MRAVGHGRALAGVEHPRRNHDSAPSRFADSNVLAVPALAVRDHDLSTELGMPAVVNDGCLADMGRMNGDSWSVARRGCLAAATHTLRPPRRSSASSHPALHRLDPYQYLEAILRVLQ
jgi:hypothetical protein